MSLEILLGVELGVKTFINPMCLTGPPTRLCMRWYVRLFVSCRLPYYTVAISPLQDNK